MDMDDYTYFGGEGELEAYSAGYERGYDAAMSNVAWSMIERGYTVEQICTVTSLTADAVQSLKDFIRRH